MVKLIDFNRLEEAYKFIDEQVPEERFNMEEYRSSVEVTKECNSIGCAIGWLTGFMTDEEFGRIYSDWTGPSIIYDQVSNLLFNIDFFDIEWEFLFSFEWHRQSDQKNQFLKRLRVFIDNQGDISEYLISYDKNKFRVNFKLEL